jgi:broad specificity phosphatase PhoE
VSVRLVYETHAITTDNEAGIATGWLPGELSAAGRDAARALGERRRHDGIDVVYVSDLRRALETVEIAFEGSAIPVVVDERLRECNYGALNGSPVATLDRERLDHIDAPWPGGGESYADVVARTRDLLADLRARYAGKRVLLVAHSANRWALQHLLQGRIMRDVIEAPFAWQPGQEFELT